MRPEEIQAAREWTARLVGKVVDDPSFPDWLQKYTDGMFVTDWHPDTDANQCWFQVIPRMFQLHYAFSLSRPSPTGLWEASFVDFPKAEKEFTQLSDKPLYAIIKAAMATEVMK